MSKQEERGSSHFEAAAWWCEFSTCKAAIDGRGAGEEEVSSECLSMCVCLVLLLLGRYAGSSVGLLRREVFSFKRLLNLSRELIPGDAFVSSSQNLVGAVQVRSLVNRNFVRSQS